MDGVVIIFFLEFVFGILGLGLLLLLKIWLSPFKEYLYAKINQTNMANFIKAMLFIPKTGRTGRDCMMVINRDNKVQFKCANFYDTSYIDEPAPPYSYLKRNATLFNMGGVRIVPIIDRWGITNSSNTKLIEDVKKLNEKHKINNYEELREQIEYEDHMDRVNKRLEEPLDSDFIKIVSIDKETGEQKEEYEYKEVFLNNEKCLHDAFEVLPFDRIWDYISSVYPVEIETYIDSEVGEYIEKHSLKNNKKWF